MKKKLRIFALLIALGAVITWAALGANRGWTKTQVQVKTIEEVTGLEDIKWKDQFVPGLDFLAAAFIGAGILAGVSLLFRKTSNSTNNQTKK